jgi:hypothetical protein
LIAKAVINIVDAAEHQLGTPRVDEIASDVFVQTRAGLLIVDSNVLVYLRAI